MPLPPLEPVSVADFLEIQAETCVRQAPMTSMNISKSISMKPILGGHETFAFRDGWLKKGVDAANSDPIIFSKDDAFVSLGVGKNMVRSIRHWCLASNLLEEYASAGSAHPLRPTGLARRLFLDERWDPYLERDGSLWLVHWQIATNRTRALVWAISFSQYLETEFSRQSLANFLMQELQHLNLKTTREMVLRELDCFLHTYVTTSKSDRRRAKGDSLSEESLDCPLANLDLIRYMPEYGLYHFNVGPKPSLPAEIFGYAFASYLSARSAKRSTISLEECIYGTDSPGQIFKLDENSVVDYLEEVERRYPDTFSLIETAGLSQIYLSEGFSMDLQSRATHFLRDYYE